MELRSQRAPNVGEVRAKMPADCRQRSTVRALWLFVLPTALYLATLAAIIAAPHSSLRLPLALAAGFFAAILFVVGHDACHGAFTSHPWLNALLGRVAFLPSWHSYAGWEHAHNHVHHGWTNLRGKDYVWAPRAYEDYARLSRFGRWRERFHRSAVGFGVYYFCEGYLKRMLWPNRSFRGRMNMRRLAADNLLVLAFVAGQAAIIVTAGRACGSTASAVELLFFSQWLPFLMFNWLIGFLIFLHHTHPLIPWFDNQEEWSFYAGQIRGTAHVTFPGPINWLIQNIMEHTAHHADPRVPMYRLSEAQERLEEAFPEDVTVHRFSLRSFFYTLRVCQLYDYREHCWTSFAGVPTSSRTVPAAEPAAAEASCAVA